MLTKGVKIYVYIVLVVLYSCKIQTTKKNTTHKEIEEVKEVNLEEGFQNPPQASKPRTWYHINSGNASKEGFT